MSVILLSPLLHLVFPLTLALSAEVLSLICCENTLLCMDMFARTGSHPVHCAMVCMDMFITLNKPFYSNYNLNINKKRPTQEDLSAKE